jgi:hypothetical protein
MPGSYQVVRHPGPHDSEADETKVGHPGTLEVC